MTPELLSHLVFASLALLMCGLALAWGWFTPKAFSKSPKRELGLNLFDLAAGFAALVVGQFVAWEVSLLAGSGHGPRVSALLLATLTLLSLAGPGVYLLIRLAGMPSGYKTLGLTFRRPVRTLLWALLGLVVAWVMVTVLSLIVAALAGYRQDDIAHTLLSDIKTQPDPIILSIFIVMAVVIAPVTEELAFRGFLQTTLINVLRGRRWLAILITGAVFGLVHISALPDHRWQAVPLAVLGLWFGWLYERTGSLWVPVLTHAAFNALNILIVLLFW